MTSTETLDANKARPRGSYFVVGGVKAECKNKTELLKYLQDHEEEIEDLVVVQGKQRVVAQREMPVFDIT